MYHKKVKQLSPPYLVVQCAIIVEEEDTRSHTSCLPWGQCITTGHHTLNSCARQRQIHINDPR